MSLDDALALPPKLPEVEHWRDEPSSLLPAALYSLADLPDADLVKLQDACESKCDTHRRGECVKPPPRWNFAGAKLDAVVKHHVEMAKTRQFDPLHFVVVAPPRFAEDGVLFVTLDSDEDECVPDAFWVKSDEAGLCFMNILIGSSDWQAEKDHHALKK
ncbi:hypothetical protein GTA08_BOTSDO01951 [Neofusicoccum parvum]|uniref:Uncharacterized protein n=2 Tax=Neofusicoccum TaxID=407951 RepID=R1EIR4_BOTPV|nr:hypothetical protein UCRNP2_5845 [Neofusicoccum parvum UCRNP2]GME51592.1 hypothetical protein GTA08_BOTSDO01951 [Neofusicoccum parvum]